MFRLKKEYTQKEMAAKLDISVRQYQKIESGQSFTSKKRVELLEDLFNVPHRVLFSKSVDEVPDSLKHFLP